MIRYVHVHVQTHPSELYMSDEIGNREKEVKHTDPWASVPRPWFWGKRTVFWPISPTMGAWRGSMGPVVSD